MSEDPVSVAEQSNTVRLTRGERHPHVATVELYRPNAYNAMSQQLRGELIRLLEAVEADDETRVIVLTGSEEGGAFCAGADVKEIKDRDALSHREYNQRPRVYETVDGLDVPVVARINGHTFGGGCELALASDIRVAREGSKIGQTEINLGIMPGGGATQRLPRLVGEGQALKLILTGEAVTAAEADDMGLVDEALPAGRFDERVDDIAANIAGKSPVAVRLALKAVRESSRMGLAQGIEYEAELAAHLFGTEDQTEGFEAFLEDRDPEWKGR